MCNKMYTLQKTARVAGLLYLMVILTGVYIIMYLPSIITLTGDAAKVANIILSNEFLFRTGILGDFISNIFYILLVLALYRLLEHTNKHWAKLMVALVVVQIPAVFFIEAFNITSLMIIKGELLQTFALSQREEIAMLLFEISNYCTLTLEMFWGLWLVPLGMLVYKSQFIPRIFGILLFVSGLAYINDSFVAILFPSYSHVLNLPTIILVGIGEISITLWLLIKGVKNNLSAIEKETYA